MNFRGTGTGLLFLLLPISSSLIADFDTDSYGGEEIVNLEDTPAGPFKISANFDYAAKADFRKSALKGEHLKFGTGAISGTFVFLYDPCYKEGLAASLGYVNTLIDWKENPFFTQDRFHILRFALAGFTERCNKWVWQAQAAINMDTDQWNLTDYATYDLLLWGRYQYCCNPDIGLHIGVLAETGMKIDRVYPIIGFDWKINACWKINAIYPINISIVYLWTQHWALSIGSRFFDLRYRVGKKQPLPKALVEYRSAGVELGVTYTYNPWVTANLHIGSILGGSLKISDQHRRHGKHYTFDGSPYVGAEANVKF